MRAAFERLTPRQRSWLAAGAIAVASLGAGFGLAQLGREGAPGGDATGECEDVLYWYDPMVPDQRFDQPGKSPFMDMQLVPKCADEDAGEGGVRIDPTLAQNFGIRTTAAEVGVLEPEVLVTGTIAYNGRNVALVQPRSGGYVQRTYGRAPDDVVARGAPLADLLVPEWGGAQTEYLAVARTGDEGLIRAARERMRLLGMPEGVIASVARTGRQHSTVTISAPLSGAITQLGVRSGMTVTAGQNLAEISGLDPIWLEVAVPEILAGEAAVGKPVTATLTAFPGEVFSGRIIAILPSAAADTRTLTARAELRNPGLRLRPGMFAQVSLASDRREALLIPSEAVIRTGERSLVMIQLAKGRYRPAEVRVGREAQGKAEILAGLAPGEKVVVSGQFLLDSEASLTGLDVRAIDEAPASAGDEATEKAGPSTYTASGTIQAVAARSVTLRHSPVPALEWPAMTMTFGTEGPAQLRGFKKGDRVRFRFVQASSGPRIVAIEQAGQ